MLYFVNPIRTTFIRLEYTSQLTTVKVVDKIIDQDLQTIAGIICCTTLSSNVKFSWTFVNSNQPSSQPSVIQEADNCDGKDGPYQLKDHPDTVVVCNLQFPLHQGKYTCTVKNDEMQVHASKSMFLEIRGKNNKSFVIHSNWLILTSELMRVNVSSVSIVPWHDILNTKSSKERPNFGYPFIHFSFTFDVFITQSCGRGPNCSKSLI